MISRLGRPSAVRRSTSLRGGEWYRIRTMTARWERGVSLSMTAAVEAVAARCHPDEAGMGQAPQSLAKAASA